MLEVAAKNFKAFGESASDCDTIAGRQSMASAYFLWKQFDEVLLLICCTHIQIGKYFKVLVYLSSIKTFFANDQLFNFNYGQALVGKAFYLSLIVKVKTRLKLRNNVRLLSSRQALPARY